MATQHTPGPWQYIPDDGTGTLPAVLSAHVNVGGNFYVAQCNVEADARLIAAAPEMLTALTLALAALDQLHREGMREYYPITDQARAAIVKANWRYPA